MEVANQGVEIGNPVDARPLCSSGRVVPHLSSNIDFGSNARVHRPCEDKQRVVSVEVLHFRVWARLDASQGVQVHGTNCLQNQC